MLKLADFHCPICDKTPKKRRGKEILCALHGWIKPLVAIAVKL